MHTPTGYYEAHANDANHDLNPAGMTSRKLHRFEFDRFKKANPHLLESTDYHIYCMVAHQDPLKMPGGPDSQARIIEEASGCHRRQRCPEIQQACNVPYEPTECSYDSRRSSQRGTPYPRSVQSAPSGGYPAYPVASPSRGSVRGSRAGSARGSVRGGGSYTGSRRGSASVDATPRSARRQEDGRRRAMSSRRSDVSGYSARSRGSSAYYDSQYSGSRYSGSRYEGSRYSGSIR